MWQACYPQSNDDNSSSPFLAWVGPTSFQSHYYRECMFWCTVLYMSDLQGNSTVNESKWRTVKNVCFVKMDNNNIMEIKKKVVLPCMGRVEFFHQTQPDPGFQQETPSPLFQQCKSQSWKEKKILCSSIHTSLLINPYILGSNLTWSFFYHYFFFIFFF
jgi:hypothetical protein